MAESLLTICRACGKTFFASITASREQWSARPLSARAEWCTHCGERRDYAKGEYFFA
jgi:hypothetical protein